MTDFAKAGEIVDIPGLGKRLRAPDAVRYCYKADAIRCPNCGGVGIPWAGWFSCDGGGRAMHCGVKALIATGEVFLPLPVPERERLGGPFGSSGMDVQRDA